MSLKYAVAIMLCTVGLPVSVSADSFFKNLTEQLKEKVDEISNQVDQADELAGRTDVQIDQTATELNQAGKQARQAIADARNFVRTSGTGTSNSMDVIGLRLGMTAQKTKLALQKYDVTMRIQEQYSQLPGVPNSRYLQRISAISNTGEQVVMEFSPPPREPIVVRLTRTTKYAGGARPSLVATLQALRQKYGVPTMESNKSRMYTSFWLQNRTGNKITPASAVQAQRCIQASRISVNQLIASQQQGKVMTKCGASLDIQLGMSGRKNGGLVSSLVATLSNPAEIVRSTQQTRAFIKKNIRTQVGSVGAPRL